MGASGDASRLKFARYKRTWEDVLVAVLEAVAVKQAGMRAEALVLAVADVNHSQPLSFSQLNVCDAESRVG